MSSQGKNEESDKRPNQENKSAFNQEGQSVQGNQTNIGKVEGNIEQVGDNYYGPVTINQQFIAPKPPRPDYINMAPDLKYFVQRPHEYNQLRDSLISPPGDTVAISAALRGAGGFGKTTLAQRLCYDEAVQQAHPDGILWVELGERPDNLVGKVNDLTEVLTSGRPTVVELNTAAAELAHAMGVMRCLMVIDDL
jgi:hypothetical protein